MTSRNPFQNGKIIGANTLPADYFKQEYHRGHPQFVMSRGELMKFDECPSRWIKGIESDETKSTEWGTLIDTLALQPGEFDKRYAVAPETYPAEPKKKGDTIEDKPWNNNATFCKDWAARQSGKTVIKSPMLAEAKSAVAGLAEDSEIAAIMDGAARQVMVTADYHDRETGIVVPFKTLNDVVPVGEYINVLADLKTGANASPSAWVKAIFEHGYHVQAACYIDVCNATGKGERTDFHHVIQENFKPYQTAKRIVVAEFVEIGRNTYQMALARYCRCLDSLTWPDYDTEAKHQWHGWAFAEPEAWMVGK